MTHTYRIRDHAVGLSEGCWALCFEDGAARGCRVIDPVTDEHGQVLVEVEGCPRWVCLESLVAPDAPRPFGEVP